MGWPLHPCDLGLGAAGAGVQGREALQAVPKRSCLPPTHELAMPSQHVACHHSSVIGMNERMTAG